MRAPLHVYAGTRALQLTALFVAYVVTARLGLGLDAVSGYATLVWPPTGIAIAALILGGRGLWPAVAAGAFIATVAAGAPVLAAAGVAAGNTLEAVFAVWLLERARFERSLPRPRDVMLLVFAGMVAPAISAGLGVLSLWAAGAVEAEAIDLTARTWWLGDALGVLLVTPALLVWSRPPEHTDGVLEAAALMAALAATTLVVFWDAVPHDPTGLLHEEYLTFPLLIWAVLRFRNHGVVTCVLVMATLAIMGTAMGHGPFAEGQLTENLLHLQGFLGFVAVAALTGSAAVAERDRARRAAELARREAEAAVVARDEFLSIAAHELKTPLTSLKLQVQQMLARPEPVPGADRVVRQVDRLTRQIDNLLDVSRAVSGRLELQPEETSLRAVLDDVIARNQEQLTAAGCELTVEAPTTCIGVWDRLRLEQIIVNLLSNAMKYGACAPIEVMLRCMADSAVLSVRDHGIGIRPEDLERIFQRFSRAVTPGSSVGGLGLGLWIVRQIVEAMRGEIAVESEPGQGATFTVTLPRRP